MTHWMYPGPFGPGAFHGRTLRRSAARLLRSSADRGDDTGGQGTGKRWKRCELRVVSCDRATQSQVDTWRTLFDRELERARKPFDGADDPLVSGGDSPGASVWAVRVELVTGRTHQVRAQLAAAGAPLLGDSLYAPMAGYLHDRDDERAAEEAWGRMERGTVPDWPVALLRRRCGGGIPCFRPRHVGLTYKRVTGRRLFIAASIPTARDLIPTQRCHHERLDRHLSRAIYPMGTSLAPTPARNVSSAASPQLTFAQILRVPLPQLPAARLRCRRVANCRELRRRRFVSVSAFHRLS